jgi:hypothetical protein
MLPVQMPLAQEAEQICKPDDCSPLATQVIATFFGRSIGPRAKGGAPQPKTGGNGAESTPIAAAGTVSKLARTASTLTVKRIDPSPLFDDTHRVLLSLLQDVRIAKFCCWRLTRSERPQRRVANQRCTVKKLKPQKIRGFIQSWRIEPGAPGSSLRALPRSFPRRARQ